MRCFKEIRRVFPSCPLFFYVVFCLDNSFTHLPESISYYFHLMVFRNISMRLFYCIVFMFFLLGGVATSQWNAWSVWTDCSATCGIGMSTRSRDCNDASQEPCIGANEDVQSCDAGDCPGIKLKSNTHSTLFNKYIL